MLAAYFHPGVILVGDFQYSSLNSGAQYSNQGITISKGIMITYRHERTIQLGRDRYIVLALAPLLHI